MPLVLTIDRTVKNSSVVAVRLPGPIGVIAAFSAWLRRKPLVAEVVGDIREVLGTGTGGKFLRALAPVAALAVSWAVRRAACVRYVTSQSLQTSYPPHPSARVMAFSDVWIDDSILEFDTAGYRSATPLIIAMGSQEQLYKGHDVLIEVMGKLSRDNPDARLALIGQGRMQPYLRGLAKERGVADRVDFLGQISPRSQVMESLAQAWVFAMPSRTEGLPRALVEAMALGLPCVGTAVGGVPELLDVEVVVMVDDVDAMSAAIVRLLDDVRHREHQSERNRAVAAGMSRQHMEGAIEEWRLCVLSLTKPAISA